MTNSNQLKKAEQLYRQGDLAAAKEIYRTACQDDPDNPDIHHALAVIAAQSDRLTEAQSHLKNALTLKPNDCRLLNSLGNIFNRQKDWGNARSAFDQAIKQDPTYAPAYAGLGLCLMQQSKLGIAHRAFEKAITLNPYDIQSYYNDGLVYCQEQQWEKAIKRLNTVTTQQPNFLPALSQLGTCYQQIDQWDNAEKILRHCAELKPDDADIMHRLGQSFLHQHKLAEAIAAFEHSIIQAPHHTQVYLDLGIATLKSGDPDKALTYFMRQLEIQPDAQCLYNIGVILMYQERHREAIQYLERATELDPTHVDTWLNLGALYLKCRQLDQAIKQYHHAHTLDPKNAETSYILHALKGQEIPTRAPNAYIAHLFDHYANFYDTHLEQHLKYTVPQQLIALLSEEKDPSQDWTIIDLGCGTGLSGKAVRPFAQRLIGIDLSPQMIAVAQANNIYDDCFMGDIEMILADWHNVDCIIAADVLSYLGDLNPIFKLVCQALKAQGYWLFSVEKGHETPYSLQKTMRYQHPTSYVDECLHQSGFRIITCQNAVLRTQEKQPIEGYLYCCQKQV